MAPTGIDVAIAPERPTLKEAASFGIVGSSSRRSECQPSTKETSAAAVSPAHTAHQARSSDRGKRVPTPSTAAYRAHAPIGREEKLRRQVRAALNKVCPESIDLIAKQIAAIELGGSSELDLVIGLIMKKALAEPHYCETYADLVHKLHAMICPVASPDVSASKPVSVKSALLNVCQEEFESMPMTTAELERGASAEGGPDDELEHGKKKQKDRMMANVKFIGHLFLRELLAPRAVSSIAVALLSVDAAGECPAEHRVECTCELVTAAGSALEALPAGRAALTQVVGCLTDLKQRRDGQGKPLYSTRVRFLMQDLLEARAAGWSKRATLKATAKTKDEIRHEQSAEAYPETPTRRAAGGSSGATTGGEASPAKTASPFSGAGQFRPGK